MGAFSGSSANSVMDGFVIYKPRIELRPYVRYYWVLDSMCEFDVLTYPIGCPQIIFHKRSPLYIPELKCSQSRCTVSGQVKFSSRIVSCGDTKMMVVVFYPHCGGMFLGIPQSEFYNREISGYDISNRCLSGLADFIFDHDDDALNIAKLESWLMARINADVDIRRIGASLQIQMQAPSTPISVLADTACLGKKQFERVFFKTVGMNPKEYACVVRFQKAMWMMQCGSRDFAGIAFDCGYADQSHFNREFKRFSGLAPSALIKLVEPYSDLFTNPI